MGGRRMSTETLTRQDAAFAAALASMPSVTALTESEVEVLHAVIVRNRSYKQIAQDRGSSNGTVGSQVERSAEKMLFTGVSPMRWALTLAYGRALERQDSSLEALVAEIAAWGAVTFPESTAESTFRHLQKEMRELRDADVWDPLEMADMFHLLVQLARVTGDDLAVNIRRKFAINKRRKWQSPDAEGVVEHVR